MTLFVIIALLHLAGQRAAFEHFVDVLHEDRQVCRMRDRLKVHALELVFAVADDLRQRLIDLHPATVGRDQRHADGREIEGAAETLFARLHLFQMPLGLLGLHGRRFDALHIGRVGEVDDDQNRQRRHESVEADQVN